MRFLIGTYTRMGGEGVMLVDYTDGKLRRICSRCDLKNPTYVIPSVDKKTFFTVGKNEDLTKGYIEQYALEGDELRLLAKAYIGRDGSCHMVSSADGKTLYTANYHTGSLSVLPIVDGLIQDAVQVIDHTDVFGRDAHCHHVSFIPGDDTRLVAVDLGCDSLFVYRRNENTGVLTQIDRLRFCAGLGPRHLVYADGGKAMYVAHELSSKISYVSCAEKHLKEMQTLSTLPENNEIRSSCAAIRISKDEKTVFVSNRGHNTIARFRREDNGFLRADGYIPAFGSIPRDFVVLDDGSLLIANQNAGGLCVVGQDGILRTSLNTLGAVCVCPVP